MLIKQTIKVMGLCVKLRQESLISLKGNLDKYRQSSLIQRQQIQLYKKMVRVEVLLRQQE